MIDERNIELLRNFCETTLNGSFESRRSGKGLEVTCSLDSIDRRSVEEIARLLRDLSTDLSSSGERPRIEVKFISPTAWVEFRPDGRVWDRWAMSVEMGKTLPWDIRSSFSHLPESDRLQILSKAKGALKVYCTLSPNLTLACKLSSIRLSESDVAKLFDDFTAQSSLAEEIIKKELAVKK